MVAEDMIIYQKPRYHQWRWRHLVKPLVNTDGKDRMFLDLGCNAGWYMGKAKELGYKTIGVEFDDDYLSQVQEGYEVIKQDINFYNPHCAYLTMLACVHYHQTDEQVEALLHKLMYSTVYLLLMGRHRGRGKSNPSRDHLVSKLKGWKIIKEINHRQFYTILVKSQKNAEFDVEKLYKATGEYVSNVKGFDNFVPAFEIFIRNVFDNFDWDPVDSDFMDYLKRGRFRYPLGRCWAYKTMIKKLQENGIPTPLKVRNGHIMDGYHRLIILRELGYERVICRVRR